jgi:hypothetical protein
MIGKYLYSILKSESLVQLRIVSISLIVLQCCRNILGIVKACRRWWVVEATAQTVEVSHQILS